MLHGACDVFYSKSDVEFGEFLVYELAAIVVYDNVRNSISAYDVLPYKLLDLLCCD